jgi:hypothetical protein
MSRELKRDQSPGFLEESMAGATLPAPEPTAGAGAVQVAVRERARFAGAARWFETLGPERETPPARRTYAWAPLFVLALGLLAVARSVALRVLLPVALAAAAVALLLRRRRAKGTPRAEGQGPRRGLELSAQGLAFHPGVSPRARAHSPSGVGAGGAAAQPLLSAFGPFGVTLMAPLRRDRLIAVLSSPAGTFSVGASFDAAARRTFAGLLGRATTLGGDDGLLEAIGPDGDPLLMEAAELCSLVDALGRLDPGCLERLVLTDARGGALTLDSRKLHAGDRTVDLTVPLEWRPLLFQEEIGPSLAIYQATWIRQGATELVLVSLLPSLVPGAMGEGDLAGLDRGALRDLRLMQAGAEEPPPPALRVAIERLFMLPLRSALDKAPRAPGQARWAKA